MIRKLKHTYIKDGQGWPSFLPARTGVVGPPPFQATLVHMESGEYNNLHIWYTEVEENEE